MHDARTRLGGLLAVSVLGAALAAACGDSETDGLGVGGEGGGGSGGTGGTASIGSGGSGGTAVGPGGMDGMGSGGAPFNGVAGGGLQLNVLKVDVSPKGVATVEFTIADDEGRPLDREGKLTYGAVSPSFILSWLGVVTDENSDEYGESTQYTAYTVRTKTPTAGGDSAIQSSTDSGGSYETLAVGHYRYTLGTNIDITSERESLTHTLGVYATRQLDDVRYVATDIESWVPDGSPVETVLDVVTTEACNDCHTRLEFHGGSRRGVEMCQLCHTEANSINPESGNTIDFQVMVHKIHMGQNLPSVLAGEPYSFVGYMDHPVDYSDVAYPWQMTDCGKCHQGSQGDRWSTRPAMKPCTSCHDRTYFGNDEVPEGWTAHSGGPRDDSECVVCHAVEGTIAPITGSHTTSITDPNRPVVEAEIFGVENAGPGQQPEIEFEVSVDGVPQDIFSNGPSRLRLKIWGPTTDVTTSLQVTIHEPGASVPVVAVECDGNLTPPCLEPVGEAYVYHAAIAMPGGATGSYLAGMDGRYTDPTYGNLPFINPLFTFAVTGDVTERRTIVDRESCNSCHGDLGEHGGGYKEPLYCLNCHNTANGVFDPEEPPAPGESVAAGPLNLKDFLHSKHASVRYPSPLDVCQQCHVGDSYNLPLDAGLLGSTYETISCPDAASSCNGLGGAPGTVVSTPVELGPAASACIGCHSSTDTVAHVQTNTAPSGLEACTTCHGPGKTYDVSVVHGLEP